jgi:RNA polymerase sigma factor (sigma-70 family)
VTAEAMETREATRNGAAPAGRLAALSRLVARGDRDALGELYELWFPRLLGMAGKATGRDEAFCLDVVQECMLRVAKSMSAMETDGDVERWMMRVVHTTAIDLLRRELRQRRRQAAAAQGRSEAKEPEEMEIQERIEWLRRELAALPGDDGRLLWLRLAGNRTLASAGAAVGLGGHAAHGRVRRALARLRRRAMEKER